MIRRSKMEILMDMVKVTASEGSIRKTRLMYRANLTWNTFQNALSTLLEKGAVLLEKSDSGVYVKLTESGYEMNRTFEKLGSLAASAVPSEQSTVLHGESARW